MQGLRWGVVCLGLAHGCVGSSDKADGEEAGDSGASVDPGGGSETDDGWVVEEVSLPFPCKPPRRYGAATTFFALSEPITLDKRPLTRGTMVVGGRSGAGSESSRLADVWIYDHAAVDGVCPWIHITDEWLVGLPAGEGVSDGALVFDEAEEQFVYAGGIYGSPDYSTTTDALQILEVDALISSEDASEQGVPEAHFRYGGAWTAFQPDYTVHVESDPRCFGDQVESLCYDLETCDTNLRIIDPCTGVDPTGVADCCADFDEDGIYEHCTDYSILPLPGESTEGFLCFDDPYCTQGGAALIDSTWHVGGRYAIESFGTGGLADMAAAYTGAGVRIYGGATGCSIEGCYPHDASGSLFGANLPVVLDLSYDAPSGWYEPVQGTWPAGERFGYDGLWPDGATLSARGWAGATLGRTWDHGAWGYASSAQATEVGIVGGTVWQGRAPLREYSLINDTFECDGLDGQSTSETDLYQYGGWLYVTADDIVGAGAVDRSVHVVSNAGPVDLVGIDAALPARAGMATAPVGTHSQIAMGGGLVDVDGELTTATDEVYLFDHSTLVTTTLPPLLATLNDGAVEVDSGHERGDRVRERRQRVPLLPPRRAGRGRREERARRSRVRPRLRGERRERELQGHHGRA